MDNRRRLIIYFPIVLALFIVLGIWLGYRLSSASAGKTDKILFIKPPQRDKVINLIDYILQDYVDSVSRQDLTENAIKGILDKLDPHSQYISAEDFADLEDQLHSNFEGIGIQFRIEKDTIMVIQTIPGGPSEKAGLLAGDRIVQINDSLVAGIGITNRDAVRQLKGKRGSVVKVGVQRHGVDGLIDFDLVRDVIPTYSIDIAYMVDDVTGYIKLSRFAANTYEEFLASLRKLMAQGMEKLILDLRGNTGGYLQAAINLADEFLPEKALIVYTEGNSRPNNYAYATKRGIFEENELIILIDEASASASEIVAGAVQDNDRGLIIGRRSFGKGLVQEQMTFPDGSAIRLTVARYHTPTGRYIQRPYTNGAKEYYEELYERYAGGEMENPDSVAFGDTIKYYTPGGRVVYGGGGIMPDIYVPLKAEETDKLYNRMIHQNLIFRYAFEYTDRERNALRKYETVESFINGFRVTDELYKGLLDYAREQELSFTQREARDSERKIKILLKAYIGRNLLDDAAFYPIYHEVDRIFQAALKEGL
ncbi:MAG: S41 family peptidase [Bacteroidales bacterium]|nr:S41 family peptidase [Bacteroidales bacterium]